MKSTGRSEIISEKSIGTWEQKIRDSINTDQVNWMDLIPENPCQVLKDHKEK